MFSAYVCCKDNSGYTADHAQDRKCKKYLSFHREFLLLSIVLYIFVVSLFRDNMITHVFRSQLKMFANDRKNSVNYKKEQVLFKKLLSGDEQHAETDASYQRFLGFSACTFLDNSKYVTIKNYQTTQDEPDLLFINVKF